SVKEADAVGCSHGHGIERHADGAENRREVCYVASVVVTNLPPVLGPVSVPLDPVPVGATVTASASFTDAGAADTHLGFVQWDLGGTFDAANPGVNEAAKSVTANSALAAGVYTIS